jgi:hypothetical protein
LIADADMVRAQKWLVRQGLVDVEPTWPVIGRIAARRRATVAESVILGLAVAAMVVNLVVARATGNLWKPDGRSWYFAVQAVTWVMVGLGMLVGSLVAASGDRAVARSLTGRVAHPAAVGTREVLGRRRIRAAMVVYPGGIATGGFLALVVDGQSRGPVIIFLAAITLMSVIAGINVVQVLRRPAVATDPRSLYVDDVLRSQDAWRAIIGPYPYLLASTVATASDSLWYLVFYVYFLSAMVFYVMGGRNALP